MEENKEENIKIDEKARELQEQVNQTLQLDKIEELLKRNEYIFEYKDKKYRVTKPSFKLKTEVNQKRIKKYHELLKDDSLMLEADLIALYEKRGINIKQFDKDYELLEKKRLESLSKLGKALKDKKPETDLEAYKKEIQDIITEQQVINAKKAVLLDTSIETQINIFTYTYLAFLTLEREVIEGENSAWIKAFDTYEAFIDSDEELVNLSVFHSSLLSKSEF